MDLGRPIILYFHAGSGNHGCEAIADSTVRLIKKIRERDGKDTSLPVILATNSAEEDRRYILGELEKEGVLTRVRGSGTYLGSPGPAPRQAENKNIAVVNSIRNITKNKGFPNRFYYLFNKKR